MKKTIVDSIDNIKSFDDFEALLEILSMVPLIDGNKILDYLKKLINEYYFSKTGLILSFLKMDIM